MRQIQLLVGLLLLQLLLIVLVWLPESWSEKESEPFLDFQNDQIAEIAISGENGQLVIRKSPEKSNRWWLKSMDLPASAKKIEDLLDGLKQAGHSDWPLTTTASAHARFSVSEDEYERLIDFRDDRGEVVEKVYLGSAPGFGRIHARKSNENEVYAIEFNAYEASDLEDDWLDGDLLQPVGALKFIARTDGKSPWSISRQDNRWRSAGTTTGDFDAAKLLAYSNHFETLSVHGTTPSTNSDKAARFRLIDEGGAHEVALFEEEEDMIVQSSRYPDRFFRSPAYLYELLDIEPETFSPDPKEAPAAGAPEANSP